MDDLDIDRAVQEALSASPSPAFVARVRTTIAQSPRPSIAAGWLKPAAAVACAVVVAMAVGLPRQENPPVKAGLKPSTTYVQPSTTYVQPGTASVVVPTFPPVHLRSGGPAVALAKAGRSAPEPLPEVIIAAEDVEALLQFVSGARDRRFVASFDETPASTPWVMTDLSVAPIAGGALDPTPAHNN